jgi:hypothetical protein
MIGADSEVPKLLTLLYKPEGTVKFTIHLDKAVRSSMNSGIIDLLRNLSRISKHLSGPHA